MDRHSLPSWLPNRPEASHRRCGNLDDFRASSGPTQPFGDALFMPLDLIDNDNALVRSSSNETPSVGSHSVEPRPPFRIAYRVDHPQQGLADGLHPGAFKDGFSSPRPQWPWKYHL